MTESASSGRQFRLLEQLSTGLDGDVYLAEQASPGGFRRRVALKVLPVDMDADLQEEAAGRIREEARLLGQLQHRNIVEVFDLVKLQQGWTIVMAPMPGPNLRRVFDALQVEGRRMPPRAAFEIAIEIADALDAALNTDNGSGAPLGVIHRDLRPCNVLLTVDGDVRVLDFGVPSAHLDSMDDPRVVPYRSPERLERGGGTPAGDIYSLAGMLVEMLTGQPIGRSPIVAAPHNAMIVDHLQSLTQVLGHKPRLLKQLGRALHAEPGRRPTARRFGDLCAAFAELVGGEGVKAFALRMVPEVDALVGHERIEVSRTLSEEISVPAPLRLDPPPHHQLAPPALALPHRPERSRLWIGAMALAAGIIAFTTTFAMVGGGLLWWSLGDRADVPRDIRGIAVTTPPALSRPVPADPVAPSTEPVAPSTEPVALSADLAPTPVPRRPQATRAAAPVPVAGPAPRAEAISPAMRDLAAEPRPTEIPSVDAAAGAPPTPQPIATGAAGPIPPDDPPTVESPAPGGSEAPSPPAAPVPEPPPDLAGSWIGRGAGRPLTLQLRTSGDGSFDAQLSITQGTSLRTLSMVGRWSEDRIVLDGSNGERFEAEVTGDELVGTWTIRDGGRPQSWSASRR